MDSPRDELVQTHKRVRAVRAVGGMLVPGGGGALSIRGKRESPSMKGIVRCARASIGRWFLRGGDGTGACF